MAKSYRTQLSKQVGKKLMDVRETCVNVKTLVFRDGTQVEIETHSQWTPSGCLGVLEVRSE